MGVQGSSNSRTSESGPASFHSAPHPVTWGVGHLLSGHVRPVTCQARSASFRGLSGLSGCGPAAPWAHRTAQPGWWGRGFGLGFGPDRRLPRAQPLFSSFPLQMNGTTPDQERPPVSEPVWERPWSVEEIRRSSQSWSLAADAGVRGGPQGPEGRAGLLGWCAACERDDGSPLSPSTQSILLPLIDLITSLLALENSRVVVPKHLGGGGLVDLSPLSVSTRTAALPCLGFLARRPAPPWAGIGFRHLAGLHGTS